jgi:hypothetical protein
LIVFDARNVLDDALAVCSPHIDTEGEMRSRHRHLTRHGPSGDAVEYDSPSRFCNSTATALRFIGGLQSERALTMAIDDERMDHAEEFVRLAGLTDDLTVRDQLIDFARGWMAAAQRERRSDDERVVPLRPRRR